MRQEIDAIARFIVRKRARGKCERCGLGLPLDLHHLHYRTVGRETPADLLALCRDCHDAAHRDANGTFWRDPSEMADYWEDYSEEMGKP